jgi:hypothetical protein
MEKLLEAEHSNVTMKKKTDPTQPADHGTCSSRRSHWGEESHRMLVALEA